MSREFATPSECPVCGETVPRGARACPGCGADERSGWDQDATRYDGLDLPDTAYDDEREHVPVPRRTKDRIWLVVTVLLLLAVVITFVLR
jgi:predicted nucleic acid-binding Zn ribbon protein